MSHPYKIIYERRVAKDLSKIPHKDIKKIFEKIELLGSGAENSLDISKLQ
jgi:mRNA-degrading endonuclease RelE of RelBE toxin-antitoxin system